jgi:hypothetical protein
MHDLHPKLCVWQSLQRLVSDGTGCEGISTNRICKRCSTDWALVLRLNYSSSFPRRRDAAKVLSCGWADCSFNRIKGVVVWCIRHRLKMQPTNRIVDDARSHVQAIADVLGAKNGMDFLGVHYTRVIDGEEIVIDATTLLLAKTLTSKGAIADNSVSVAMS